MNKTLVAYFSASGATAHTANDQPEHVYGWGGLCRCFSPDSGETQLYAEADVHEHLRYGTQLSLSCLGYPPFTSHTEKQLEAMRQAGIKEGGCSIYELTMPFLLRLMKSFL